MTPSRVACTLSVGDTDSPTADASRSAIFARPKSRTLTLPSGVILMFAGFRSRCTTPRSCAASSASAICRAIDNASSSSIGPRAMRSASVSPSTSSRTIANVACPSLAPRLFDAVHRGHVGMVQRGQELGFTLEAGDAIRIGGERVRQDLDRDLAAQLRVASTIDLAHSAGTKRGLNLVWAETGASG